MPANTRIIIPLLLTLVCSCSRPDKITSAEPDSVHDLFTDVDSALRKGDQPLFKSRFVPAGFEQNLAGESGLSGEGIFRQAVSEKWTLSPVLDENPGSISMASSAIVSCSVRSTETDAAYGQVFLAVVIQGSRWLILGGAESLKEVQALVGSWKETTTSNK